MAILPDNRVSLYGVGGFRKYINGQERDRLLKIADSCPIDEAAFILTLTYTGCRLSEALSLTRAAIQSSQQVIAIRCLKKRDIFAVREVPVPPELFDVLARHATGNGRLWPWSRTSAWRMVKKLMATAAIEGHQASPKGLRHGFGVHAVRSGVPIHLVQRWLGHSNLRTTAIYADVVGAEELEIAARMWSPKTML